MGYMKWRKPKWWVSLNHHTYKKYVYFWWFIFGLWQAVLQGPVGYTRHSLKLRVFVCALAMVTGRDKLDHVVRRLVAMQLPKATWQKYKDMSFESNFKARYTWSRSYMIICCLGLDRTTLSDLSGIELEKYNQKPSVALYQFLSMKLPHLRSKSFIWLVILVGLSANMPVFSEEPLL